MYVTKIAANHGETGLDALRTLLERVHQIYAHIDPADYKSIVIFRLLNDKTSPLDISKAKVVNDMTGMAVDLTPKSTIQILDGGRLALWRNDTPDTSQLSHSAIVYSFTNTAEQIYTAGEACEIPRFVHGISSVFAVPGFTSLRDALEHYRTSVATYCGCKLLEKAWSRPADRIFFGRAPESKLRDSLTQYLSNVLRGAEVRAEQNMDEDHPVDIKVTWVFARRLALIEIKWLGWSIDDGTPPRVLKKWTDKRARDGARQLAEYLEWNKTRAPNHITRGWLVIYDARRKKLQPGMNAITKSNGRAYRQRDIAFTIKYDEKRDDFEPPVRFFMEPVCSP
ncbi:MAG: hypothetical protein ACO1OB_32360 [Archangium sp.]